MHSSRTLVAAVALSAITVFAGAGSAVAAPVGSVDFGSSSGSGSGTGSASGSESGSVDFGSGGPDVEHPVSTCFWSVPINPERADPQLNYAFPDTAAITGLRSSQSPRTPSWLSEGSMRMLAISR